MIEDLKSASQYIGSMSYREFGSKDMLPIHQKIPVIRRLYEDRTEYAFDYMIGDGSGRDFAYNVLVRNSDKEISGKFIRVEKGKDPEEGFINNLLVNDCPGTLKIDGMWIEDALKWEMSLEAKKVKDLF